MKITVSVIKADIGSIGGHVCPSADLLAAVKQHVAEAGQDLLIDHYISSTGDEAIHKLAWDAFVAGTEVARRQGLYGAGQALLKEAFSDNVHGMGPAIPPMSEPEYTGIMEKLTAPDDRFRIRD